MKAIRITIKPLKHGAKRLSFDSKPVAIIQPGETFHFHHSTVRRKTKWTWPKKNKDISVWFNDVTGCFVVENQVNHRYHVPPANKTSKRKTKRKPKDAFDTITNDLSGWKYIPPTK